MGYWFFKVIVYFFEDSLCRLDSEIQVKNKTDWKSDECTIHILILDIAIRMLLPDECPICLINE